MIKKFIAIAVFAAVSSIGFLTSAQAEEGEHHHHHYSHHYHHHYSHHYHHHHHES